MKQNESVKTIYLVRHGHVQMPDYRKYYLGSTDLSLSETGKIQAAWQKNFFLDKNIEAVYHSPLMRCVQTARMIADKTIPCISVSALREIDMGQWEMVPMEQVKKEQPEAYYLRGEQMDIFCPPDGESFAECQKRSVKAFQDLTDNQKADSSIMIVAHAGVNRCVLSWILQKPLKNLLAIPQAYACVTKLIEQDGIWQIADYIECPV